jgi:hypothetical protein
MKSRIGVAVLLSTILLATSLFSLPSYAYVSFSYSYTTVPSIVEPGTNANILLTITNGGTEFSGSTKLTITPTKDITASISSFDLQTLGAGSSVQVVVPIAISPDAPLGVTVLPFKISYTTANNAATTDVDGSVAVTITRRTIMQIVDVKFDKNIIQAGDSVNMTLTIMSNGQGKAKNMVVSIPSSNVPIAPTMSDSEKYVGTLNAGDRTDISFSLTVNTNAESTIYNLPIMFSYYDDQGNSHNVTKFIGFKVTGIPAFVVSLDSSNNVYLGSAGSLSINVANTGTGVANFVTATMDSDVSISPKIQYLGDMNPDDTNTIVLDVNPTTLGDHRISISLVYRDSYNQEFTQPYSVDFSVATKPVVFPFTYVVLIIAIAVILLYWKRNAIFKRGK